MAPEKILHALLRDSAGLVALVQNRIYPLRRPQGDPLPAVVYRLISEVPSGVIDQSAGPALMTARVQIDALASNYSLLKQVIEQIKNACHLKSGTVAGCHLVSATLELAGPDDWIDDPQCFVQPVDIRLIYYV
ncbi:DUF3168 domain-containing protein [Chitinimonas sp. PSY-7]|uniref:tail completion protein gp17 n=1 Tax=Chitinimonas sp. PSY-7 TaxID=3459088 RepID=UPI004040218F